jgi:LPS sulfotransferase NodH
MSASSQPKSFSDILRYHTSFLVNPIQWTSRHLDLVGCRFEDVGTTYVDAESTQNDHRNNDGPKPCPNTESDAEEIATNIFPLSKRDHLVNILVGKERPFSSFR